MSKDKIIKQIPNILTISRIVGSILLAFIAPVLGIGLTTIAVGALALTDLFDGLLARKLNASSELGGKLDAISDKLFIAIIMYVTIRLGSPYANALLFPIAGETSIAVLNTVKYKLGYEPQTIIKGKIKTWALSGFVISTFLQMEFEFLKNAVECLLACTLTGQLMTFMGYCDQENELANDKKVYNKIDEIKSKIKDNNKEKIYIKNNIYNKVTNNTKILESEDLNMEKDKVIKKPIKLFLEKFRESNFLTIEEMAYILGIDLIDLMSLESGTTPLDESFCNLFENTFNLSDEWNKILEEVKKDIVKGRKSLKEFLQILRIKNSETPKDMMERLGYMPYLLGYIETDIEEMPVGFLENVVKAYNLNEEEKKEMADIISSERQKENKKNSTKTLYQ